MHSTNNAASCKENVLRAAMRTGRYGHMVHQYYLDRLRAVMAERRRRLDALTTRADAERYVAHVRRKARRCFSSLPKRTPMNPRTTGRIERDRFVIEKVLFESRPGFLVTGNLYLPKGSAHKRPGVLGLCGHSIQGKAYPRYQSFMQGLAVKGFVVFSIDPIAQGERRQYYRKDGPDGPQLCQAHNMMGNQMLLVGDFFGSWRLWDAIRALDYLVSRAEVDARCIGVTGNSGGGTLTNWLTAVDPRPTMVAPCCHVSSYLADLENELPRDAEQNPPGLLAAGLDMVDLLLCYAPRPTIILAQTDDFFDERAARRAYHDLRKVHRLLGSPNAAYFAGPHDHNYHIESREAMYRFFLKHAGLRGNGREQGVHVLPEKQLFVTARGETHRASSRRVFEFTSETAAHLKKKRGRVSADKLMRTAKRLLALPAVKGKPHYRVLRAACGPDSTGARYQFAVETEPGVQAIVSMYGASPHVNRLPTGNVRLHVGHTSSTDDVRSVPAIRSLVGKRIPLLAVDVRGIGETQARTCGSRQLIEPYGSDFLYASTADMLGESLLGRRVFDLMRTIDCLSANGVTRVDLIGRGLGSVTAAFAALLHRSRPRVRLIHYLPSFQHLAETPIVTWPASSLLRGVLKHFDLPDVYRALGKRLRKERPWNARMRPYKG